MHLSPICISSESLMALICTDDTAPCSASSTGEEVSASPLPCPLLCIPTASDRSVRTRTPPPLVWKSSYTLLSEGRTGGMDQWDHQ